MEHALRLGDGILLVGEEASALLDERRRELLRIPHAVTDAAAGGGSVALLAGEPDLVTVVRSGRREEWSFGSLHPRTVAVAPDGAVAVRCERIVVELPPSGEARLLYDARVDPALPAPAEPFLRWRAAVGLSIEERAFMDASAPRWGGGAPPCDRELEVVALRVALAVPTPTEAPESLEAFLADFPGHSLAPSLWGEAARRWRALGRRDRALAALEAAARIPQGPRDRDRSLDLELVQILQEEGRHERAIEEIDELLARLAPVPSDPAVFDASFLKGQILAERLGRPQEAVPIYEELLHGYGRFFPEDASLMRKDKVRLYLGMALEASGRPGDALPQYEAIVSGSVTGTFVRYATERAGRLRGRERSGRTAGT